MNSPSIDVRGLGKVYREEGSESHFRALEGVDLTIAEGEFVSLIGPSGCGKTTLLKIIDGLIPYDEGELFVQGKLVKKELSMEDIRAMVDPLIAGRATASAGAPN